MFCVSQEDELRLFAEHKINTVKNLISNLHTVFVLISTDRAIQELSNGSLGMKIGQLLRKIRPFLYPGGLFRVPQRGVCANWSMCAN